MEKIISDFTTCLSYENNIEPAIARSLVEWMQNEGVLDYGILNETYGEARPTFSQVAASA